MDEKGPGKPRSRRRARLPRERRREQILKSAELLFAAIGMRSTTTSALAKAAGISEAILYRHFGAKQKLFERVVERNTQQRLAGLEGRLSSIPNLPPLECIDRMAEASILACTEREGNASVMAWALLEMPEFAAEVYRGEIGATEMMWDGEIRRRFADSPAAPARRSYCRRFENHLCAVYASRSCRRDAAVAFREACRVYVELHLLLKSL